MQDITIKAEHFPNLHYRKTGSGPAVVLIHGFPEDGSLWEHIYPALAGLYTVLVPDIPGSGESLLGDENVTIEELAGSIEAILAHENISEAVIVGHSMGGYITLAFAEKRRAWLRGISLVHSTATADTEEKKKTRQKAIELIRKGGKEPFVKGMVPNLFSDTFKELHPDIIEKQVERGMKLEDSSMIAFYNAMINRHDRTSILKDTSIPVQWIIGKEDTVVPVNIALQQARMAKVNFLSLYSYCGHMSMLEQPEKLASDLKDFISYCFYR